MNRREFIKALGAAGIVAVVGIDLVPRWRREDIRSALEFREVYSIEFDCYIQHARMRSDARLVACSSMGGFQPATDDERAAFLDVAAQEIEDFLNREGAA